VRGMHDV